jgi:hypothetical protein
MIADVIVDRVLYVRSIVLERMMRQIMMRTTIVDGTIDVAPVAAR